MYVFMYVCMSICVCVCVCVCMCVCVFSNIFSETTGPVEAKFHVEPPWNREGKVKKISKDQELIQSDPTSCPQNQKGNN